MFKIPDWEDDIPKNALNFDINKNRHKKSKSKCQPPSSKNDKQPKPDTYKKKNQRIKAKKNDTTETNDTISLNPPGQFVKRPIDNLKSINLDNPKQKKKTKLKAQLQKSNNSVNSNFNKSIGPKENGNAINVSGKKRKKIRPDKSIDVDDLNTDQPDEIVSPKKRKYNTDLQKDDLEVGSILMSSNNKGKNPMFNKKDQNKNSFVKSNEDRKKEKLKKVLSTRSPINVDKGNKLRERMLERLKAAQFRYLNEKLYTSTGPEAQELFQSDPEAFQTYHEGYRQQLKKWPVNPLELIINRIKKMPKSFLIADMGCGEGALARRVTQRVRSFDLVSTSPAVEACDMAHTPLLRGSVDAVVYCLALMGTHLTEYLVEASRVLKTGGHLLIAEVESRFEDVDSFTGAVQRLGFKLKNLDKSHQVFFFMEFTKVTDAPSKRSKMPDISLKPCLYKKR